MMGWIMESLDVIPEIQCLVMMGVITGVGLCLALYVMLVHHRIWLIGVGIFVEMEEMLGEYLKNAMMEM